MEIRPDRNTVSSRQRSVGYCCMEANKTAGEEARRQLHKNAASNIEQVLTAIPNKAPTIRTPASHHENYTS